MTSPLKLLLNTEDIDVAREIQELRAVLDSICSKPKTQATTCDGAEQDSTPAPKLDPSIHEFRRLNEGR